MIRSQSPIPKIVYAGGHMGTGDFPDHCHENAWELIYLCEGEIVERIGKQRIPMSPGTFVLHPPASMHGDSATGPYFLLHVLIASDEPLAWPRSGTDVEGEPLRALLAMIVHEWYSNGIGREGFLRHCMSLLDILMKRFAVQTEESQVARNVVASVSGHFRRHFQNELDMREVAHIYGVSRSTLYSYFHRVLRKTPQEVLDGIRIRHALYLLRHSSLSMEEIARGSGYCSASHLGRKLRAAYGKTGRQLRGSRFEDDGREPTRAK